MLDDGIKVTGNTTSKVLTPCDVAVMRHRVRLCDIVSRDDIDLLTVRQLKDFLADNCIDHRDCCERQELVKRVHELWADHKKQNTAGKFKNIYFMSSFFRILSHGSRML